MKLTKAIEILEYYLRDAAKNTPPDSTKALELALWALKRQQLLRHQMPYNSDGLLPGETKE